MMDQELQAVNVHTSLNTPNLLLGADRELILIVALLSVVLIVLGLTMQTAIMGVVFWSIFSLALRMMAKADPMMRKIYIKQLKYKSYYLAHSTPFYRES